MFGFCKKILYNKAKEQNMCINRHILLVSKRRDLNNIKEVCIDKSLIVTHATNFCDTIESLVTNRFSIIFISKDDFPITNDFFDLIKRNCFFVPFAVILSETPMQIDRENTFWLNPDDIEKASEIIDFCKTNNKSQNYLYTDSYLKNAVDKSLALLGFSPKYKGYTYLSTVIFRVMTSANSIINLQNSAYPFVASLFGVSVASVERDVRNLISHTIPKLADDSLLKTKLENRRPSCKNVIHIACTELKEMLKIEE